MRTLKIIVFLLFGIITAISAQTPTLNPEQTVNPATGEMGFSLPLATVKGVGGKDVPVSLNYSASIRYSQQASPVGLGFSYGPGIISRKKIFVPDDNTGGPSNYYFTANANANIPWWVLALNVVFIVASVILSVAGFAGAPVVATSMASLFLTGATALFTSIVFAPQDYIAGGAHTYSYKAYDLSVDPKHGRGIMNGASDDLPDVYFISSPYLSGEMRWVEGNRFVLRSTTGNNIENKETVRIRYENGSFHFTLADGTRLFFDRAVRGKGASRMYVQGGTNSVPYTAWMCNLQKEPVANMWMLTKVLFPDYVDGDADDDPTNSLSANKGMWVVFEYDSVLNTNARQLPDCMQAGPCATMVSTSGDYFHELYLRTIKTPNEYAQFSYSYDRKDDLWFPVDSMTWWLDEANGVYNGVRENNEDGTPSPAVNNNHTATYYCKSKNGGNVAPIGRGVLDSLTVYTPDGKKRKTVHFNTDYVLRPSTMHSYTKGTDYDDFNTLTGNAQAACLTLLSLEFESAYGNERKLIEFNYSSKNPAVWDKDVELFPEYPSNDMDQYSIRYYPENRDLWGYYSLRPGTDNDFNITGRYDRAKDADGWSLEEVVFPTGLKISWEYEPNRYDASNGIKGIRGSGNYPMVFGGGIRVKKVTANDGISPPISWRYVYTCDEGVFTEKVMPGDTSNISGHATVEPFNYFQVDAAYDYRTNTRRRGGLYTPAKIAYELVQVIKNYQEPSAQHPDGFAPEGFTAYRFLTSLDQINGGLYGDQDLSWMRGYLKEKSIYNSKGQKISSRTNEYEFIHQLVAYKGHNLGVADSLYKESLKYTMGIVRATSNTSTVSGVPIRKEMYYQTEADNGKNVVDDTVRMVDTLVPATQVPLDQFTDDISGGCVMVKELGSDPNKDDMILVLNYSNTSDIYLQFITDMEFANGTGSGNASGSNWYHDNTDIVFSTVLGVGYANVVLGADKDLIVFGEENRTSSGGTILHPCCCPDGNFSHLHSGTSSQIGDLGTTKMTTAVLHDFDGNGVQDVLLYTGGGTTLTPTLLYVIVNPDFAAGSYNVYTSDPATPFTIKSRYATVAYIDTNGTIDLLCAGPDVTDPLQGRKPITRSIIYDITLDAATRRVVTGNHVELTEPAFVVDNYMTQNEQLPDKQSALFFGFGLTDIKNPVFAFGAHMRANYPLYLVHSKDHVVYRDYNGQPDQVVEYLTGDSMRITVPKAAYISYPEMGDPSVAGHRHMIAQTSDNTTYGIAPSTALPIVPTAHYATAISAQASQWDCADGWCLPFASYRWNMNMTGSGYPENPLNSFVHTIGATNNDWDLTDSTCSYSRSGFPQEIAQPIKTGGRLKSTTIYGYNGTLPIASVTRAEFQECGVFTGDYQCTAEPSIWWDKDNGWEKGGTNPPSLDSDSIHFGQKAIKVEKDFAAARNFLVEPGKSYTMTGWVKVTGGTGHIRMDGDFRYLINADAGWPLDWQTDMSPYNSSLPDIEEATPLSKDSCDGSWRLMTMEIPAGLTRSLDASKTWYCRAWVGDDPGNSANPTFTAYIDDIRFAPSNAMVSSTYYDQLWQQPVISVDANNHPGRRVTYDSFGRPVKWEKVDPAKGFGDAGYAIAVQKKVYNLMYDGLVVESPDRGDEYAVESPMEIRWINYKNRLVDIFYSDETGSGWTHLQRVTPVTGQNKYSYTWNPIPGSLNDGDGYRIKIVDVNDPKVLDISEPFAIRKARIIRPTAQDVFQPGSAEEIQYYVYGGPSVQVTIAINGVDSVTTGNTGSWVWEIPPDFTEMDNALIEVRGDNGSSAQSEPFTIKRHNFIRRFVYRLLGIND